MPGFVDICLGTLFLSNMAWARCTKNDANVFVQETSADSFLSRSLLANNFDFELVVPGNLERECYEEICSYEEAREVFEDDQKTNDFWKAYKNSHVSSTRIDVAGLAAGIVAVVVAAIIALVLGCYVYKSRSKNTRQRGSVPVQMAADSRPGPETVPLSSITAPGLPSYNEALIRSGQHDAPPPPYTGTTPSAPQETQQEE